LLLRDLKTITRLVNVIATARENDGERKAENKGKEVEKLRDLDVT